MKLITLLKGATGQTPQSLASLWGDHLRRVLQAHGAAPNDAVLNLVQPVELRVVPGAHPVYWQLVSECWFTSLAAAQAVLPNLRADLAAPPLSAAVARSTQCLVREELLHEANPTPPGQKVMAAFTRRADLSRAASQAYWRGPHARLGMVDFGSTRFMDRYIQNHVLEDYEAAPDEVAYDGMPEFWMSPTAAMAEVSAGSDVMLAIAKDEANFIDRATLETMMLTEQPLAD